MEVLTDAGAPDPFTGRTIGDRYRIGELLNVGGMGRVYKGIQTSLERPVAIKLIHPHLLTSEEVVGRFLTEARASSRLNHPNVVSIYDFGRMPQSAGGHLFLVMELLTGKDLRTLMDGEELGLKRIADILRQTLAALGEAHHVGITHRDVKPENILLEMRRGESSHVKVIDFGIAHVGGEARRTQAGRVFGTPWYMAPEQASGGNVGPAADLYAVGVMLFEMLTGKLPFDDDAPADVLIKQMSAPRPDPREMAPERSIPDELATVCLRALEIDPGKRFSDAESFAAAIVQTATREAWSSGKASMFPKKRDPSSKAPPESGPRPVDLVLVQPTLRTATGDREVPLVAREEDLATARAIIAEPNGAGALVLYGRPGIGRSRMARAIADEAQALGASVISVRVSPSPTSEVTFSGLAALVFGLAGLGPDELVVRPAGASSLAAQGLRAILLHEVFGGEHDRGPEATRRAVDAAVRWAARRAALRAGGKRVVVVIDDVHYMDPMSQCAVEDLIENDPPGELFVIMTSERQPEVGLATRIRGRELRALSREEATHLLGDVPLPVAAGEAIEPLYVDVLRRFRKLDAPKDAPGSLAELVEHWLRRLPPGQQRTIQAIGVTGGGPLRELSEILPRGEDLDDALRPLSDAGVLDVRDGQVRLRNEIYGRIAVANAPGGAISDLHARAREMLDETAHTAELRAYHALRTDPSFETFMVVEEAARVRARSGNEEAAIALLWDAMSVAREQELRGESEAQVATSAHLVFGRKLADALIHSGRLDQAQGVLAEILELAPPNDAVRAHILERLAAIAYNRGRTAEAEQRRAEAQKIADWAGDRGLTERLKAPLEKIETKPPRRMIFKTPSVGIVQPRPPASVRARRA